MIDPKEAADEPSPTDPASRLSAASKQMQLALEDIGSETAAVHHQLAIEIAWIEATLNVETKTSVSQSGHATLLVEFPDGTTPAEARAALATKADADKVKVTPSGDGVTVRLVYDNRTRNDGGDDES